MIKYKCKICGGEYVDVCQDGLQYYHACPPIKVGEDEYTERPRKRDENKRELAALNEREILK